MGNDVEKLLSDKARVDGILAGLCQKIMPHTKVVNVKKMEMYYVEHNSLWLDIKILFKTVISVIKKEGSTVRMDIKIIVATHKKYWMPSDDIYLPVHVGKKGKTDLGYQGDDTGDNISDKNTNYCELTGLYWAWKNLKADYKGLSHYRRHFMVKGSKGTKEEKVINRQQLEELLKKTDIILPNPRNYFIETNYSQYVHAHHAQDLDVTRQILDEKYPDYVKAFDETMKSTIGHRFNMFIMKSELFDSYCEWMFDILFELEKRLDISDYSAYDARVFGFVSERLLDIWIKTNKLTYINIPVEFMEKQNWLVKGTKFLERKIGIHR